jgi:hypothetical protein
MSYPIGARSRKYTPLPPYRFPPSKYEERVRGMFRTNNFLSMSHIYLYTRNEQEGGVGLWDSQGEPQAQQGLDPNCGPAGPLLDLWVPAHSSLGRCRLLHTS